MTTEQNPTARVSHRFKAAPERVFDAWLDPALIGQWMFGPALRDEEVVRISLDPRPGGSFSFVVRRQGEEIDHIGEYLEIDRPRRLVFTWGIASERPDSSQVIVEITPQGTGCEVILSHVMEPKWADFVERSAGAWAKMLNALDKLFT